MRGILAIVRRELAAYFDTPLGAIVLAAFLLAYGFFFFFVFDVFGLGVASLRGLFAWGPLVLAVGAPIATMRLLAEDRATGTDELLATLPLTEWQLVLGKYLAGVAVLALGIAGTAVYPALLSRFGDFDWGPVLGGYLGLLLLAAGYAAVGLLASALSRSQVVAALLGLLGCGAFWIVDKAAAGVPGRSGRLLRGLGFDHHFAGLQRGVVTPGDVAFYVAVAAVFLAGTTWVLRRRRLA